MNISVINFINQWQFWNPHDKQSLNLSLVFEIAEELTEIIDNEKDDDEINFWKLSTVFNLKYLNQNFIKLSMYGVFRNPHDEQIWKLPLGF